MKTIKFYLIVLLITCTENVIAQSVTLHRNNIRIKQLFREITKQTGYSIFYADSKIDQHREINADFEKTPLRNVLDYAFKNEPVTYTIANEIILFQTKTISPLAETPVVYELKGKVLDEEQNPIWGSTIKLKNTNIFAYAKQNGEFTLRSKAKEGILLVSNIGYESQEIKTSNWDGLIILRRSNTKLDEVQVIAYGKNTSRYNLGSVNRITAEEIERQPVANLLQALQGSVPGLSIAQTNGFPTAPFEVAIRGINNLFTLPGGQERYRRRLLEKRVSDPLYLVDGVPIAVGNGDPYNQGIVQTRLNEPAGGQSPIFGINPSDIESVSILKDADATAIYGVRAANGVVLITTKSGQATKNTVQASINTGVNMQGRKLDLMRTPAYLAMREMAFKNDGLQQTDTNATDLRLWDKGKYTDWQKELLGPALTMDGQVGLSGGKTMLYRINTSMHNENLPLPGKFFERRNTVALSLNYIPPDKKWNFKLRSNYANLKSELPARDPIDLIFLAPNAPAIYNEHNLLNVEGWKTLKFPLSILELQHRYHANTDFLTSNLNINYSILPKLMFNASLGYSLISQKQNSVKYEPLLIPYDIFFELNASGHNKTNLWIAEPNFSYNFSVGKSTFETLLGGTLQYSKQIGSEYDPYGYFRDPYSSNDPEINTKFEARTFYQALFARIKYDFLRKYLFTVTGRLDGSSRFGKTKQINSFGSLAAGWIISEENFFKAFSSAISFLKVRSTYGLTGGDGLVDYAVAVSSPLSGIPYQGVNPLFTKAPANKDLTPALNQKFEVGLDMGFLNDRFLLSLVWYNNRISNHIVNEKIPVFTGYETGLANVPAIVQNRGGEFTMQSVNLLKNGFSWKSTFSINVNHNKLIAYPNIENSLFENLEVGKSIDRATMKQYIGIDEKTGKYKFWQLVYKDRTPYFTGALQNSISYKKMRLDILFVFCKQMGMIPNREFTPGNLAQGISNIRANPEFSAFTTENDDNANDFFASNAFWTDASYIRLQNISLNYQLPVNEIKGLRKLACNIFIEAQNLFTLTKYDGFDVERPVLELSYPTRKIVTAGMQLNF